MKNIIISSRCVIMEKDMKAKILYCEPYKIGYVALKPIDGDYNTPICIPQENIFCYDESLFEELENAYQRKDKKLLSDLWFKAERWEPKESLK